MQINIQTGRRPNFVPGGAPARPPMFEGNASGEHREGSGVMLRLLDFIIIFSLGALFFGLPLFFLGLTFQGIAFEKQIYFYFWLLLGLIAWAVKGVILGEIKIRRTPLDIPIVIFWAIYLFSAIFSVDRWHSFWGFFGDPSRGLMSITALVLAYYLITSNFSLSRLNKLLFATLVSAGLVSLWILLAILNVKFLPNIILKYAPLSTVGSVSGIGIFLSTVLPLAILGLFWFGAVDRMRKASRIAGFATLGTLIVINLVILQAFFNYVYFPILLAGLIVFLIYVLSRIVQPKGSLVWVPMAVFVAILAIMMIGGIQEHPLVKRTLPTEVSIPYPLSWKIAKAGLKDSAGSFFLGSGPATYGYNYSLYKPQEVNNDPLYSIRFFQGAGMFFEYLSTIGILGIISFLLLVVTFLSFAVYLLSREKERNKIYSLGVLSAAFIAVASILLVRVEGAILILGTLIASLAVATVLEEGEAEKRFLNLSLKASPKYALAMAFVFLVVCVGAVFLFVYLGKVTLADTYVGQASREKAVTEDSVKKVSQAIDLYGREGRYFAQAGQMFMVLANQEMLKDQTQRDTNKVLAYLNAASAASRRGVELMKKDVAVVESLAFIYENSVLYVKDSLALSEENYKQSQALEPTNPNYPMKLGQIKEALALAKKDDEKKALLEEAKTFFQQSIDLKKNFAPGHYNLAMVQEALGDKDGAIQSMTAAWQLRNSDINYNFNLGRMFQARGKGDDNALAEALFKRVLGINDKEVNAHFYLALTYETQASQEADEIKKADKTKKAVEQYKKVLELIPAANQETRTKIQEMVDNLNQGRSNVLKKEGDVQTPEQNPSPVNE